MLTNQQRVKILEEEIPRLKAEAEANTNPERVAGYAREVERLQQSLRRFQAELEMEQGAN